MKASIAWDRRISARIFLRCQDLWSIGSYKLIQNHTNFGVRDGRFERPNDIDGTFSDDDRNLVLRLLAMDIVASGRRFESFFHNNFCWLRFSA